MKKIVVADDELRIRMLYEEVLTESGYEVYSAKDGKEAWEFYQKHQPDLVILDVKMPEMHGFDALEKIRSQNPNVPSHCTGLVCLGGAAGVPATRQSAGHRLSGGSSRSIGS